jgi:hypothetical protein
LHAEHSWLIWIDLGAMLANILQVWRWHD